MSWMPPERPDWVEAINRGEVLPISEEAWLPLSRDGLLTDAAARQGLSAQGSDSIETAFGHPNFPADTLIENLDRLTYALETEAALTPMGRWMTRRFLLRILEVRLQLMNYLAGDPGVQEEIIASPLFVAGAPRTGTTILHTLLAADPNHRVPEGWELLRPVPPPDPDPKSFAADPRIALADRELLRPQMVVTGLMAIHSYGGRRPKECLSAMSFALQSEEFTARYHVPSYASWLERSDMTPAYRMHELVLRVLQRRRPGSAWVLKSPVHLHSLPTLFETYPDAQVAITHRDPHVLLGSLTSLIANLRFAHSDRVDVDSIAAAHHERYARSFGSLVDWVEEGRWAPEQLHQSHFEDFLTDPLATVAALYSHFGRSFEARERKAMEEALASHPRTAHGSHEYAEYVVDSDDEPQPGDFDRYRTYFKVRSAT